MITTVRGQTWGWSMTRIGHIFIALCKTSSNKYILVQQTLDHSIAVNKQICLVMWLASRTYSIPPAKCMVYALNTFLIFGLSPQTKRLRCHGVLEVAFLLHEPMRTVGKSARRPWLPASMIRIFHYWMIKKSPKMNAAAFVSSESILFFHFKKQYLDACDRVF